MNQIKFKRNKINQKSNNFRLHFLIATQETNKKLIKTQKKKQSLSIYTHLKLD
jgi:hypothetical protein